MIIHQKISRNHITAIRRYINNSSTFVDEYFILFHFFADKGGIMC